MPNLAKFYHRAHVSIPCIFCLDRSRRGNKYRVSSLQWRHREFSRYPVWNGNRTTRLGELLSTMRLLAYLYLLCQSGALFTIPPTEQIYHVIITPLAPTTATVIVSMTYTTSLFSETTQNIESIKIRFPVFTLTTMAPLSRNALEMRQKYLNDQGIGMDCGAWTGSHCTRVLPVG